MSKKTIFIITFIVAILILGFVIFSSGGGSSSSQTSNSQTITTENGKQIVSFKTKGGYIPTSVKAKSGEPTILRFVTQSSFDCSTAVTIPSLQISKNLPNTGTTDIEIPTQKAGTNMLITCSMGMYSSRILFE